MKKYLLLVGAVVAFASCTTISKTARTESIPYAMYNANVADLEVGDRVSYTIRPEKSIRRGGDANVKKAVIQEVLEKNGNADLLVEPQFVISKRKGMFGTKINSITVTGRPAKYKNFRSLGDNVWTDPVFRGTRNLNYNIFQGEGKCCVEKDAPKKPIADKDDKIYDVPEESAEFPGDVYAWLSKNIKYPAACKKEKVQGRVSVEFVVNKEGNVENVRVVNSPDARLSTEAMCVVKAMPKWKPARQSGKNVRMRYVLPVMFKL